MLVIGLTGGIGSGKTTVANFFQTLGAPVIDTDQIARELVMPGTTALEQIIQYFGAHFLQHDGNLNRATLRQYIFQHPAARIWLEELLHPIIRQEIAGRILTLSAPYCLVVIPLLAETSPNPLIHRVLVVDCSEQMQIQRAIQRDHITAAEAQRIMQSQTSREERNNLADDIILNERDVGYLQEQVLELHRQYVSNFSK